MRPTVRTAVGCATRGARGAGRRSSRATDYCRSGAGGQHPVVRSGSPGRIYSALAVLVLALLCFPASSSADLYDDTPLLNVGGDSHLLGQSVDLEVDLEHLDQAGDTERLVVTVPSGYAVNLVHPVGADLGSAAAETVPTGGGNPRLFLGTLVVMDPAAYAASASAQACSPGAHAALWQMQSIRARAHTR